MNLDDPSLTFAVALAAGMLAQIVAGHLRLPGIVLLLLAGVLLGPDVAAVVRPSSLGTGLHRIVDVAVAVILFDGGLGLEIGRIRREALVIRRLVTLGAAVTAVGGAVAGRYLMGWSWQVAIPFGTLVVVTGPTVITPLLRRVRVKRNLGTILTAEGVLIDPIGAIAAVVALEVALSQGFGQAARGLVGVPTRLLLGAAGGILGGLLISGLLASRRLIPERLESVATLSLLLVSYAACEAVLPQSGVLAAPIAGMVLANSRIGPSRQLREFKEQLTILLVGLLFILLAADVRLREVADLGSRGALVVAALIVVVRPLNIAVGTFGAGLTWRERAFLSWMAPRGIVAAAMASLFAETLTSGGMAEGRELQAMVFLVIASTVVVQGLGGRLVASMLGLLRPSDSGFLIAGANPVARVVAKALMDGGEEVVLVDMDAAEVHTAEREGLTALTGNALDEELLDRADVEGRRGVIGLIQNEGMSLLIVEKARRDFRVRSAHVAIRPGRSEVIEGSRGAGTHMLFGAEADLAHWSREIVAGRASLRTYRFSGPDGHDFSADPIFVGPARLPVVITRRSVATPVDELSRLRTGDRIAVLHVGSDRIESLLFEPVGGQEN